MSKIHLILGGARSGKSSYGEKLASAAAGDHVLYIATAEAGDEEMQARIEHHRCHRNPNWTTLEAPQQLAEAIAGAPECQCVLVDCLTLWLAQCLEKNTFAVEKQALLTALQQTTRTVILISNEVGSGITPLGQLTRQFVDQAGWLHQELAAMADKVTLVVAGLPMSLKPAQKAE